MKNKILVNTKMSFQQEFLAWLQALPEDDSEQPPIPLPVDAFRFDVLGTKRCPKLSVIEAMELPQAQVKRMLEEYGFETDVKKLEQSGINGVDRFINQRGELILYKYVDFLLNPYEITPFESYGSGETIILSDRNGYNRVFHVEFRGGQKVEAQICHGGRVLYRANFMTSEVYDYSLDSDKLVAYRKRIFGLLPNEKAFEYQIVYHYGLGDNVRWVEYRTEGLEPAQRNLYKSISAQYFNELLKRIEQYKKLQAQEAYKQVTGDKITVDPILAAIEQYL